MVIVQITNIFDQCGYVPEEKFNEILSEKPNIDNSPERNGKSLNDISTNCQRCLVIDNNKMEQHKEPEKNKEEQLIPSQRKTLE